MQRHKDVGCGEESHHSYGPPLQSPIHAASQRCWVWGRITPLIRTTGRNILHQTSAQNLKCGAKRLDERFLLKKKRYVGGKREKKKVSFSISSDYSMSAWVSVCVCVCVWNSMGCFHGWEKLTNVGC